MNHCHNLKGFSLFIFILFSNCVINYYYFIPYLYDNLGSNGIFLCYFVALLGVGLVLLIPAKITKHFYQFVDNSRVIRIILGCYFLLRTLVLFSIVANGLVEKFFFNQNPLLFFFAISIISLAISKMYKVGLINIGAVVFIFVIPLLIMVMFFVPNVEISAFLPLKIQFSFPGIIWGLIGVFDICFLFLVNDNDNQPIKKKWLCFGIITSYIVYSLEYFLLIGIAGDAFFKGYQWVGISVFTFQRYYEYIGNFDFIYIYLLTTCAVINGAYAIGNVRILFHIKRTNKGKVFFAISYFVVLISFFLFFQAYLDYFGYAMLILLVTAYLIVMKGYFSHE